MLPIVIQAAQIVTEREDQYRVVVADMSFMAILEGDGEIAPHIWQEAWSEFDGPLQAFLVSVDIELRTIQ